MVERKVSNSPLRQKTSGISGASEVTRAFDPSSAVATHRIDRPSYGGHGSPLRSSVDDDHQIRVDYGLDQNITQHRPLPPRRGSNSPLRHQPAHPRLSDYGPGETYHRKMTTCYESFGRQNSPLRSRSPHGRS